MWSSCWWSGLHGPLVCSGVMVATAFFRRRLISRQLEQIPPSMPGLFAVNPAQIASLPPRTFLGPNSSTGTLIMLSNVCWDGTNYPDEPLRVCTLLSSTSVGVPAVTQRL